MTDEQTPQEPDSLYSRVAQPAWQGAGGGETTETAAVETIDNDVHSLLLPVTMGMWW
ncbi:MAG: hypothetical protein ACLQVK_05180 [Acidimicrobiales bacterium]